MKTLELKLKKEMLIVDIPRLALLEKATIKQPEYVMGVDTYDKDALAYCFGRKVDGVFEIMLSKKMRDEKEFKQEVENLAKYFNADVLWSGE